MSTLRRYWCWKERTCWVCSNGGELKPIIRAVSNRREWWEPPRPTSPCATVPKLIFATSRTEAIAIFTGRKPCHATQPQ